MFTLVPLSLSLLAFHVSTAFALDCSLSAISGILPANATVVSIVQIPINGTFGEGASDLEFPLDAVGLPELCAVKIHVISSPTSSYNFGIFLPEKWNNRFLATGNGGFGGGINWQGLGTFSRYGFASVSTDTGHISGTADGSWALNNPEAVIDWGYRAMHGSVVIGKQITDAYYGEAHKYAYYSGCSTGGRQGLKEVQMYPSDFNGVLAGAPAWWTTHLQTWSVQVGVINLPANASTHIPESLMTGVVASEITLQCDPQDGLKDNIISNPYGCDFDPSRLLCSPSSNTSNCLTGTQISTLRKLYSDWTDANQTLLFPHYALGSEAQNGALFGVTTEPAALGTSWVANFLYNNASWDYRTFSSETVAYADAINPGHANADDFDLAPFRAEGGKLLHYHGLADGLIATGSSIYFYNQVLANLTAQGLPVEDFYRFFLVPGMQHCMGSVGDAPNTFGGVGQDLMLGETVFGVPGFEDVRHDALLALMAWVEQGAAPESIVATKFQNDSATGEVVRQRPLCMFPMQARWNGTGDVNEAESWTCESLY